MARTRLENCRNAVDVDELRRCLQELVDAVTTMARENGRDYLSPDTHMALINARAALAVTEA